VRLARLTVIGAAPLALGGCGDEPAAGDAMRREAAQLVRPQPGQYESTVALVEYAVPGASPQDADLLREQMGALGKQVSTYCLSAAEAAKGFEEVLREGQDGNCRFEAFSADRHRMNATMVCNGELPQATSTVEMRGNGYTDRSDMRLEIEQRGAPVPGGVVRMTLAVDNRRTGPCA